MNTMHSQDPRDPLARFRDGAVQNHNGQPIPLRSTHIDVRILGGLAVVRTERIFRNDEAESIEATLTFPVPVHAVLTRLTTRIGERTLTAQARRKDAARARYEAAIDAGRTAVLHEQAMPGIHILSVGHVPPGNEVAVSSVWAQPLARTETGAALRIPTTRGGSGKLDSRISGVRVPDQASLLMNRSDDEQTTSPEPYAGLQGEGGLGGHQGRQDAGRSGAAI